MTSAETPGPHPENQYGAGLGYRSELSDDLALHKKEVDVVEIMADGYPGEAGLARVREIAEEFPAVVHGVGMSVAGAGKIPDDYLRGLRRIIEACAAPYYSEHLAMTHVPGLDSGHLCPPIISEQSLRTCIRNVDQAQSALGVPLALENITYSVSMASDHLAAASFFADIVSATGCLILLDVANLYINSKNHSFDPLDYLDRLPMDRVVHIHLAGGFVTPSGKHVDSHSQMIDDGIWKLAGQTAARCAPSTVIVERDQNFPDIVTLLEEVRMGRDIFFPQG